MEVYMYREINANTEDGFEDLEFDISNYYQDAEMNHIVRAMGKYNNDIVGFDILFKKDMSPGIVEGKIDNKAFYDAGIIIRSIGKESDKFIEALSKLYNVKKSNIKMASAIEVTSYALEGNPQSFNTDNLKFKVFFDDCNKIGLYAELYINISLINGVVEFREKDIEYRQNVLRALAGHSPSLPERLYKKFKKL